MFRGVLLWGLHQVKKDIIGDGKGHLIGALFLFKLNVDLKHIYFT